MVIQPTYCLCFGFFMIANLLDNRMYFIFVHLCLCLVFFRLHGFPFLALMSVIKISYFNASLSSLNSTAWIKEVAICMQSTHGMIIEWKKRERERNGIKKKRKDRMNIVKKGEQRKQRADKCDSFFSSLSLSLSLSLFRP